MRLKPEQSLWDRAGKTGVIPEKLIRANQKHTAAVPNGSNSKTGNPRIGGSGFFIGGQREGAPAKGSFPRSLESLASSLDLPKDASSALLISAFRSLSLPFSHAAVHRAYNRIRAAGTSKELAAEVAAAAESKGLDMSSDAFQDILDLFAVESAGGDGDDGGTDSGGRNDRKERRPEADPPYTEDFQGFDASDLREALEEADRSSKTLSLMNRLRSPEKKRWIAFPLNFAHAGVALRASVRILLQDGDFPCGDPLALTVDAACGKRRWSIRIDRPGKADSAASIRVFPPLGKRREERLAESARAAFKDFAASVRIGAGDAGEIQNGTEQPFPPAVEEEA